MAMRATASLAAAPRGLRRLFCTTSTLPFVPPPSPSSPPAREQAEPNTNLFVSGLNKRTTSEKLWKEFSQFGEVVNARVVTDRVSGYSKGFGFVKYATLEDAKKGIEGMDGKASLDFKCEYARPRQPPTAENNMGPGFGNMRPPYGRQ